MNNTINELALMVAKWRKEKGFKTPSNIKNHNAMLAKLMLVVTELAEATEAVRHGDEENFKEEIADTYIRLLDITGSYKGFDTAQEILKKMQVNEGRPKLHGKRC
jgi:NTP pyrophosphatase (non-canonical NTP hydrolase)